MNPKRSRILYVEKPTSVGGSVISLYELVRGLDKSRYEPTVLFHGPNPYREQFRALGIKVITLSNQSPAATPAAGSTRDIAACLSRHSDGLASAYRAARQFYLAARRDWPLARRVARLIKDQAIDLVHHNNGLSRNRDTVIAARLAGASQVCHVRMLRDLALVDRYVTRFVDCFVYISRAVRDRYRDQGIPAGQGQIVYNPVNVEAFAQSNHTAELRAELGLADQDRMISNVGRLDWWKGHDDFVRAMAEVVRVQSNARAVIVGTSDAKPQNQAYYQHIRRLVQELGLADHVIFTGYRSDVPRIMAASDIVVHSASEPEPFGRVVVEGMAAGRPVIATAAGGVLDIIEDQVNGLLVPPKNAERMSEAIQWLLQNQAQARAMGQRAQQCARDRFSVEQHVQAVQRVYQKVLVHRDDR
jgi:glycosyltransferase involved in cell wall biosynthesis